LVSPHRLIQIWPKVAKLLAQVPGGYCSQTDYFDRICSGQFQLWVDSDEVNALALGEVIQYPQKRVYSIFIVIGQGRQDWQDRVQEIEAYAREKRCRAMRCLARKGWERVMKPHGYEATHVVLEKDI
jgi:hypothetical protein